jgi:hypothetical protein
MAIGIRVSIGDRAKTKGVRMANDQKVWVLMHTIDPDDQQWGIRTESQVIGVFSTIENARKELDNCRKDLEKIEELSEYCIYGDYKKDIDWVGGCHVLLEIFERVLDHVGQ